MLRYVGECSSAGVMSAVSQMAGGEGKRREWGSGEGALGSDQEDLSLRKGGPERGTDPQ